MTKRATLTIAAVAALALPSAASAAKPDCFPKGSKTVTATDHARVYTVRDHGEDVAHACLYSAGRRIRLDFDPEEGFGHLSFAPYRLAGPYVAYLDAFVPLEPDDNRDREVWVRDLRTGEIVRDATAWVGDDDAEDGDAPQPDLVSLRLSSRGRAAWISEFVKDREVWRLDSRGARRLDRKTGSSLRSLAISSTRVTWVNDGVRKSASFR